VKPILPVALLSIVTISLMGTVSAEPPAPQVQREVEFLLNAIGSSGCEFYRNGVWHDAKAAQAHVGDKYEYLLRRDAIKTTEDFIEKAATRSSLSDEPYRIRCNGSPQEPTHRWLHTELSRFRSLGRQPGASLPRSNPPQRQNQRGGTGPS
jgi:Family of unknown function (DUF5329)